MSNNLLLRLAKAATEAERSWIVTESLLHTLSPELSSAAWTAVIPHWFDAEILAALRPELSQQAAQLDQALQTLSFVEVFPGRGHNIHERTRRLMLERLWQQDRPEFYQLSARAAEFFATQDSSEAQIERLYHQIVQESAAKEIADFLWDFSVDLNNSFRYVELDALADTLMEQVRAGRATPFASAVVCYRKGNAARRVYQMTEALEHYQQAIGLYQDVGARLGEANTLQAIGKIEPDPVKALDYCQTAFELYVEIGDQYSQSRNLIYFTSAAQLRLGQTAAAIASLTRAAELAAGTEFEFFQPTALEKIQEIQAESSR